MYLNFCVLLKPASVSVKKILETFLEDYSKEKESGTPHTDSYHGELIPDPDRPLDGSDATKESKSPTVPKPKKGGDAYSPDDVPSYGEDSAAAMLGDQPSRKCISGKPCMYSTWRNTNAGILQSVPT